MSVSQNILVMFFAVFWGAVFNVQSRWLMFQPILSFPHIRRRFLLSFLLLSVAPILFFVYAFYSLRFGSNQPSTFSDALRVLLAGVLPAFSIFGFYRLWMSAVQFSPQSFYQNECQQHVSLKDIDPTIQKLYLTHSYWCWNFLFAIFYFVIASLGLCIG